jgi:hypothetical protein
MRRGLLVTTVNVASPLPGPPSARTKRFLKYQLRPHNQPLPLQLYHELLDRTRRYYKALP